MSKQVCIFLAGMFIVLALFGVAEAKAKVTDGILIDANFRPRLEIDHRWFDGEGADQYATTRTSIGLTFENLIENTEIYFLMEDSRMMGFSDPYLTGYNIGMNKYDNNLGVNKAYLKVNDLLTEGFYLKIGRQDNDQGRGRIFGAGNWSFYGPRVYDGVKMGYNYLGSEINLWYFYGMFGDRHWPNNLPYSSPYYPPYYGDKFQKDHSLIGADITMFNKRMSVLFFCDWDSYPVTITNELGYILGKYNLFTRWTGAFYYSDMIENVKIEVDAAHQFGHQVSGYANNGKADINAFMLAGEVSYNFDIDYKPWLGIGWDIVSGEDDDPGEITQFYEEYYSKHRFQGRMDYFKSMGSIKENGLNDFFFIAGIQPVDFMTNMLELHFFRTQYAYASAVNQEASYDLGYEVDITNDFKIRKGLKSRLGINFFLPNEDWQGEDAKNAWFIYWSMTAEI